MKISSKLSPKMIIIASVLIVLVVAAIVVAVVMTTKDDVPTFSESTGESTTNNADPSDVTTKDNSENTTGTPSQSQTPTQPETSYINPLTGEKTSEDLSKLRPAAFMINNIKQALPQQGISSADVLYECLAEGGITRLLMLVQDYKSLNIVGSIRSSRDYYLDFAQNHDALYFHAGGSEKAYSEIAARNIDNYDGVRMNIPNTFYRDSWRLNNMAYEHTLVITGQGVQNAINYRGKRTELKNDFNSPFRFEEKVTVPSGNDATCVYLPFSYYQTPYLKYDSATNTYKRWQYNEPHIDKDNNKQLEFTNILVLFCHHTGPLDSAGRIEVTTTGSGSGYYISNGKYVDIKYTKDNEDSPIKLFTTDYTPLKINVGKTYIAIFDQNNKSSIEMNYDK